MATYNYCTDFPSHNYAYTNILHSIWALLTMGYSLGKVTFRNQYNYNYDNNCATAKFLPDGNNNAGQTHTRKRDGEARIPVNRGNS